MRVKVEKKAQRQWTALREIISGGKEGGTGPLKGQERAWIHRTTEKGPESLNQDMGPRSYPAQSKLCSVKKLIAEEPNKRNPTG